MDGSVGGAGEAGASHALHPNPDWASLPLFDRTGWRRVRFGDVVRQLKEVVDPVAEGVERYVAGEHMETENVHIRKWGQVGDGYLGPAFIRRFRRGQVLYGSRRTYLKKVAVAEWDGVTANTTFVLEAVEGRLLPELLPWLMLSERFTKHSIQASKGSTNPYINFPDIAKFEFALPPLDQQRGLAEILWAVDDLVGRYTGMTLRLADALAAARTDAVSCDDQAVETTVADVCETIVDCPHTSPHFVRTGVLVVRNFNIHDGYLDLTQPFYTSEAEWSERVQRLVPRERDLLFSREAPVGEACLVPPETRLSLGQRTMLLRADVSRIIPEYLLHILYAPSVQREMRSLAIGSTVPHLNVKDVRRLAIKVPPIGSQECALCRLNAIRELQDAALQTVQDSRRLRDTLTDMLM